MPAVDMRRTLRGALAGTRVVLARQAPGPAGAPGRRRWQAAVSLRLVVMALPAAAATASGAMCRALPGHDVPVPQIARKRRPDGRLGRRGAVAAPAQVRSPHHDPDSAPRRVARGHWPGTKVY